MPKPLLLPLLACGLSACSLAPLQPTTANQALPRAGQSVNRVEEWNQLARHYLERGQVNLAMGAYAQSLALDAGQLEARNAVAVIEAQRGHLAVSRQALLALTRDYPGEAMPHTNLGYVYYLEGDLAAARQILQRAMALGGGSKAFQNLQQVEQASRLAQAMPELEAPAGNEFAPASVPALAAAPVSLSRLAVASAGQLASVATVTAATSVSSQPRREEVAFATGMATDAPLVPAAAVQTARVLPPSIPEPARRVELVQLSPSIFELKQQDAPVRAAVVAEAPALPGATATSVVSAPPSTTAAVASANASMASAAPVTSAASVTSSAGTAGLAGPAASAASMAAAPAKAPQARTMVAAAAASAPVPRPAHASAPPQPAPAASLNYASIPMMQASLAQPTLASAVLSSASSRAMADSRNAARPGRARLEIANGNGIEGMAKRFRGVLSQMGIQVDRLSNDKPYRQVTTTIQYSPGFEKQAASLQKALQGQARLDSQPLQGSDLRLVLGKDAQETLTSAGEATGAALMASTPARDNRRN